MVGATTNLHPTTTNGQKMKQQQQLQSQQMEDTSSITSQISGRLENDHFFGKWRFHDSNKWFDFDLKRKNSMEFANSSSVCFKGQFSYHNNNSNNKNSSEKMDEVLTLTKKGSEGDFLGQGSNSFGEFKVWGKCDELTHQFEGFKKYYVFHQQPAEENGEESSNQQAPMASSSPLSDGSIESSSLSGDNTHTSHQNHDEQDEQHGKKRQKIAQEEEASVKRKNIASMGVDELFDSTEDLAEELQLIEANSGMEIPPEDDLLQIAARNAAAAESEGVVATADLFDGLTTFANSPFTSSPWLLATPSAVNGQGSSKGEIDVDESKVMSPVLFQNQRLRSGSQESIATSGTQPDGGELQQYLVRLMHEDEKDRGNNDFRSRARKRVRDFVLNLQNRHFFPYDMNDFSLGLPDSHPLKPRVQIIKIDPNSTYHYQQTYVQMENQMPIAATTRVSKRKFNRLGHEKSKSSSYSSKHHQNVMLQELEANVPKMRLSSNDFRFPASSSSITSAYFANSGKSSSVAASLGMDEISFCKFELDGSCYEGELLNGLRHGKGMCGYWNGSLYVGEFRKGVEHGLGELRDATGALIYRGEFEHGKICGHGTFYYADGSVYRGEMREGQRHGRGIIWYADGNVYEGDFVHGKRAGSGTFLSTTGSSYVGEWSSDVRHGRGVLKLKDGTVLDGSFKDNHPDGRCTVSFSKDNSFYEGNFKDGFKDGRGTYTFGMYNAVYEGRFARDAIGGIGTLKLHPGIPIELPDDFDSKKSEWMMPIDLQCEVRSVHLKAGFGVDGM